MQHILIILFIMFCQIPQTQAEWGSAVFVDNYSSPEVQLSWRANAPVNNATYSMYHREKVQNEPSFWKPVAGCTDTMEIKGVHHSLNSKVLQFRSSVNEAAQQECLVLGDFEQPEDLFLFNYAGKTFGFNFLFDPETVYGERCMAISFNNAIKSTETLQADQRIGILFSNRIKTKDWSTYRYLEFAYWAESNDPIHLCIKSASQEIDLPVSTFTETPFRQGWNQCVVDLERYLGQPYERKALQLFAFLAPGNKLDLTKTYTFKLDQICLWKTRAISETIIDPTPPTTVKNLQSKIDKDRITWTWDVAEDPESGIQGYSYTWGKNQEVTQPDIVKMNGNEIIFPIDNAEEKAIYHFMIKACNGAGQWSDAVTSSLEINTAKKQ